MEKGVLQSIMTDSTVTQRRRYEAGLAEHDTCFACAELRRKQGLEPVPETAPHIWWLCPAWKEIRERHITPEKIKVEEWPPCWAAAGLLPAVPEVDEALQNLPDLLAHTPYRHEGPAPQGWESFEGEYVEVFSDGSVQAPRGRHYMILRRAGQGAAWGDEHSCNFAHPMVGPAQTIVRAELAGALEVMRRERRPLLLRIDNQWVL